MSTMMQDLRYALRQLARNPVFTAAALVAETLDRFGIVAKKDLYPSQLSGGQQLVAVARAVIARPELILADEPTGSLHSRQGAMVMHRLRELNADGVTIVQVTHSPDTAAYGNRVVELLDGHIVSDTGTSALHQNR